MSKAACVGQSDDCGHHHHVGLQVPQQQQQRDPNIEFEFNFHKKSLCEAYLLCIVGFLGTHHFYLGRYFFGMAYLMTFGLAGIGWVIDWFRMPCLVNEVNRQLEEDLQRRYYGQHRTHERPYTGQYTLLAHHERSLVDAYMMWFPYGLYGFHHFYLRRYLFGILYSMTFGLCGVGWLIDAFRMPFLVKKANDDLRKIRNGEPIADLWEEEKRLDDAYTLSFPLGFLGLHHFYLNRIFFGFMYLFTFGLCGVGMLVDWFRLPCLVNKTNAEIKEDKEDYKNLFDAYLCGFPLGFLGLHHFYLRNPTWGVTYLFTLGLFGIGWLVDLIRMPSLVKSANEHVEQRRQLYGSPRRRRYFYFSGQQPTTVNHAGATSQGPQSYPHMQHGYPRQNNYLGYPPSTFQSGRPNPQPTYPQQEQQSYIAPSYQGHAPPQLHQGLPPPYCTLDDHMGTGNVRSEDHQQPSQSTQQSEPTAPPYIKM